MTPKKQDPQRTRSSSAARIFSSLLIAILAFLLGVVLTNQVASQQQWEEIRVEMQDSFQRMEDNLQALGASLEAGAEEFAQDTEAAIDEAADEYE